jgi:hypothetical protein
MQRKETLDALRGIPDTAAARSRIVNEMKQEQYLPERNL